MSLGNSALPITYAYAPGEETDGATVRIPLPVAGHLTAGQLPWMVPGLREEQIGVLLRALPKTVRKTLMPLEPRIREIAAAFEPARGDFLTALAAVLSHRSRDHPYRGMAAAKPARILAAARQLPSTVETASPQTAQGCKDTRDSSQNPTP